MKPLIKRFWTYGHRPFVMGGSVYYVLACDLPCTGPYKLGKGYSGYLATSPTGQTYVCESRTGAIVGPTLARVRLNIEAAKPAMMRAQVAQAAKEAKEAEVKTAEFFWHALSRT